MNIGSGFSWPEPLSLLIVIRNSTVGVYSVSARNPKRQPAGRAQSDRSRQHDPVRRHRSEAPTREPDAENGERFRHRKPGADTGPRSAAERDILETVAIRLAI